MPRRSITVTDDGQLTYVVGIPVDAHFAAFINGSLLNDGDEFVFGPEAGEITLTQAPSIGDVLEFRRL